MAEAGQPLGRASPDDESGLEPRFSVPSAVGGNPLRRRPSTIRSSRAFKHPNGAALRIAPLFGPALSDHVRAGPFALRAARRRRSWADPYCRGACSWSPRVLDSEHEHDRPNREPPLPAIVSPRGSRQLTARGIRDSRQRHETGRPRNWVFSEVAGLPALYWKDDRVRRWIGIMLYCR